ncbi:polysaccharide deacetylase family protein [Stakelama marina]|uniref:Chitooligosaccharide deacetylase n=1 Tax=Stakelama marina TaxID=2826939 RepID=A0A8T4IDF1_9SPHN|nr:polysaccharide deacetylase family protein [Stakelama marina]MBR0552523.1 polysaccharide deacetylase family protein [Stakelama marina]
MIGLRRAALVAGLAAAIGAAGAAAAQPPKIAITFDDIPAHGPLPQGETRLDIVHRIISALKAHGVDHPFGFFNGGFGVGNPDSPKVVAAWRAAGFALGNHSYSHGHLGQVPLAKFEDDVAKNEPVLKRVGGKSDWRWFRYPFLDEGDTPAKRDGFRSWLGQRGYRVAAVTMSFDDYAWNAPYARCVAKRDRAAIARLEKGYLDAARAEARRVRILSYLTQGREIPYVLLMHLGAFDARMLPRLLDMYQREGFRFVPLPQAERDPFYRFATNLSLAGPTASLGASAAAAGVSVAPAHGPLDTLDTLDTLDEVCR